MIIKKKVVELEYDYEAAIIGDDGVAIRKWKGDTWLNLIKILVKNVHVGNAFKGERYMLIGKVTRKRGKK